MQLGLTPWDFTDLSASALTEQAVQAEAMGFQSFWLPENHFNPQAVPDPLMLLAGVAAATRKIKLATTSYLLPLRHPLQAAEQVAVLDNMCGGRVLLGVGRGFDGDMLRAFDVAPKEKRRIFEASLRCMRQAWSGEPVDVGGGVSVVLDPLPLQQPHPPVWVAAFGPKALAQAGRLGLPYLASPMETLSTLQENYALYGQATKEPVTEVPIMRTVYVARDGRDAKRVRTALAELPRPRDTGAVEVDEWALIGEASLVRELLADYVESLSVTHLVATRLRLPGFDGRELIRSLESLAMMIH